MNRSVSRAARLREIENLLLRCAHGLTVMEIASTCAVNRRTIYRDIALLEDTGVPIWQNGSRFGIIREHYLATIRLTLQEAMALYIASRLLAWHADEHNPHIVSALHKLATAFPDPLADHISKTAEAIRSHPVNTEFVRVLETISLCWTQQRKVRIWYYSPRSGTERTRVISPYTIEPSSGGGLYIVGHDDWSNSVRTFKIERVEKAEALQETYTIPPTFDPVTHFAHAWGIMGGDESPVTVRLRFSSGVAPYIRERIWHPSQTLTEQPDGALELAVRIAKLDEMRPWIRSWGADVTVIEPETLCHDIAEEARRLVTLYHQR